MDSEQIVLRWPDWFPQDKIEELEDLAGIGYTPKKIALYFGVNEDMFMREFMMPGSALRYHYNKGALVAEAKEAIETLKSAKSGNATQGQRLDKKRYQLRFEELKEKHIYGEE